MSVKLYSMNSGNIHEAVRFVNEMNAAPYVLSISPISGVYSIILFRVTDDQIEKLENREPLTD